MAARRKKAGKNTQLAVLLIIAAAIIIAGLAINLYQMMQPAPPSTIQGKVTVRVGPEPPVEPTTTTGLVTVYVVEK